MTKLQVLNVWINDKNTDTHSTSVIDIKCKIIELLNEELIEQSSITAVSQQRELLKWLDKEGFYKNTDEQIELTLTTFNY